MCRHFHNLLPSITSYTNNLETQPTEGLCKFAPAESRTQPNMLLRLYRPITNQLDMQQGTLFCSSFYHTSIFKTFFFSWSAFSFIYNSIFSTNCLLIFLIFFVCDVQTVLQLELVRFCFFFPIFSLPLPYESYVLQLQITLHSRHPLINTVINHDQVDFEEVFSSFVRQQQQHNGSMQTKRSKHSWWWDSHISSKSSKWLSDNVEGMNYFLLC